MRHAGHIVGWTIASLIACQESAPTPPATAGAVAPSAAVPTTAAVPSASGTSSAPIDAPSTSMRKFEDDLAFLGAHGAGTKVLQAGSGARIAVSGKYQARVMTSAITADGDSLGFVNRAFIEAGKTGTAFDNYGGEDRFWLGPEGGQYALYFAPGQAFEFEHWQTPHALQEGEWQEQSSSTTSVTFRHTLSLQNYARSKLDLAVTRTIALLTAEQAKAALGLQIPASVSWVGYESNNRVTNQSPQPWTEARGLPSIWILGMFNPAPGTRIILPFERQGSGEIVNDRYFGQVPKARLLVNEDQGFVLFKADGQARGKIGLSPSRAKSVLGSYSAAGQLLTIVRFSKPAAAKRYVNNLWEVSPEPYGGDVSNAYNDGPVEPGKPSLGGFYELESSSPAVALAPGASHTHTHETYHFSGPREALAAIAAQVLGVSLSEVEKAPL